MQISLGEFDGDFFQNLDGSDKIYYSDDGRYHTLLQAGKNIGVVGFLPGKNGSVGFVQIVIKPEYRGQGLLRKAEDRLACKYDLDKLFATIDKSNKASIYGHMKAGFEKLSVEQMDDLRKQNLLKENEIRLVKEY